MLLKIDFCMTYEMLFKLSKLFKNDKVKFKKEVIKFEVALGESIGLNDIKISNIDHSTDGYSFRDSRVLACTTMFFIDDLPFNLQRVTNIFNQNFINTVVDYDE
ncbi:MAG: hypothetical protein ACRCX2_24905 [Paraclostridium sp.]